VRIRQFILFLILVLSGVAACAQVADDALVDAAYPADLFASRDPEAPSRFSTFVAADLNRNGQLLLVALYTNGTRAGISVLDRSGHVLSHPDLPFLKGFRGELEAIDLDADGVPEIIARLVAGHGYEIPDSWVFAWRNGALTLISPTAAAHNLQLTPLSQVATVDMDGSGKLSLLAFPGVHRDDSGKLVNDGDVAVYAFSNGKISATTTTFSYAQAFYRRTSGPTKSVANFAATPGRKTLRIINGTGAGNPVDSGRVTLNGVDVVRPADFKPKTHVIEVSVQLAPQNHIEADLTGKPGSGIWVMVVNQ
jgi:hypothetical protein